MKITELKTDNGSTANPCELVDRFMLHDAEGGTLAEFMRGFEFESDKEIAHAIKILLRAIYSDPYLNRKTIRETEPLAAALFNRAKKIMDDPGRYEKYPTVTASEIWHGGYNRMKLAERTKKMFAATPDPEKYQHAANSLRSIYGLSPADIEKLHFFVEQTKAGEAFPDSLRRMLYIWGVTKRTGKTTCAKMLVTLLNGENDESTYVKYVSTLPVEMQIKPFVVPKIAECNCVMMDECFYFDMTKTYTDFKRFLTSNSGKARLPYGQEFQWVGFPNYVATSNDPLRVFIKDWDDRRYLSIEFKGRPSVELTFDQIREIWREFIVNSTRDKSWQQWANDIEEIAREMGERSELAKEFEAMLGRTRFLNRLIELPTPKVRFSKDNKFYVRDFIKLLSEDTATPQELAKRREEIESAILAVFGPRYSTTIYWLLTDLKERANELVMNVKEDTEEKDDNDILPF